MEYTVKTGDTLSAIAQEVLGDALRWPEIYAANRMTMNRAWEKARGYYERIGSRSVTHPADHLTFGQVLHIPTGTNLPR